MRKIEFSKKIFITASVVNICVVVFSCYMMYKTENLEPLTALITATAAELATGTGFYYSKAKAENRIKLMKDNNVKPSAEYFKGDAFNDYE